MDLINEGVMHKSLGEGKIIYFDGQYVTIQFRNKRSKILYPSSFEKFLVLNNTDKQEAINDDIVRAKQLENDKKRADEEKRQKQKDERLKALASITTSRSHRKSKTIDEMFSEDYHSSF